MAVLPLPRTVFLDANGKPLIAGLVWTYVAGTQTPVVTYQDQACSIPNTNPVTLDAAGSALIFGLPGVSYSFQVFDVQGTPVAGMSGVTTSPAAPPVLFAYDAGATNSLQVTLPTAPTGLAALTGLMLVVLSCRAVNTGASTINVNGLGAVNIVNPNGTTLVAGQISAGGVLVLVYDGAQFELVSPVSAFATQFTSSLGDSGWWMTPDGLIEQWGTGVTANGTVAVSWPRPFPTVVYRDSFIVGPTGTTPGTAAAVAADLTTVTTTGANVYSAAGTAVGFTYRVKGK